MVMAATVEPKTSWQFAPGDEIIPGTLDAVTARWRRALRGVRRLEPSAHDADRREDPAPGIRRRRPRAARGAQGGRPAGRPQTHSKGRRDGIGAERFPQLVERPAVLDPARHSPGLSDLVMATLGHDPARRPSAAELFDRLDELAAVAGVGKVRFR